MMEETSNDFPTNLVALPFINLNDENKFSANTPLAVLRVYCDRRDFQFSKPFHIWFEIENVGQHPIDRDAILTISDYPLETTPRRNKTPPFISKDLIIYQFSKDLNPNKKTNLTKVIITPSPSSSIENYPGAFKFSLYVPKGRHNPQRKDVKLENSVVIMGTQYFLGEIHKHKPQIPGMSFYNILFFGVVGSGKSTGINTMITSLSERYKHVAIAAGKVQHVTLGVSFYPIKYHVKGLSNINFVDTMGLNDTNYQDSTLEQLLDGEIPEGWNIFHNGEFIERQRKHKRKISKEMIPVKKFIKKAHVVLFFVTANSVKDSKFLPNIENKFIECNRRGLSPLLVVTQLDLTKDEIVNKYRTTWAEKLQIPEHTIYFLPAYVGKSAKKNFSIDQPAMDLLLRALWNAHDFVEREQRHIIVSFWERLTMKQFHDSLKHVKKFFIEVGIPLYHFVEWVIAQIRQLAK